MATKSFEELNTGALTIKNNELPESNTHTLVGNQLVDMVAKEQEIDGKAAQLRSDLNALEQEQIQGGVYDVSSHNDGAVFESISTLLGSADLSTLIPESVRRGGMSIRFIQGSVLNSDNKYVQYRLLTQNWSTNTEDWAVADEGVYVENPEFVYVKTDNEGKILEGIKTDGTKVIATDLEVDKDTTLNGNAKIEGNATISGDATILGKVDIQGTTYTLQENPEWIKVLTDAQDRIIAGVRKDGSVYIGQLEGLDDKLQEMLTQMQQMLDEAEEEIDEKIAVFNTIFDIIQNPEFISVETDNDGNVLGGRKVDGSKEEYLPVKFKKAIIDNLELSTPETIDSLKQVITDNITLEDIDNGTPKIYLYTRNILGNVSQFGGSYDETNNCINFLNPNAANYWIYSDVFNPLGEKLVHIKFRLEQIGTNNPIKVCIANNTQENPIIVGTVFNSGNYDITFDATFYRVYQGFTQKFYIWFYADDVVINAKIYNIEIFELKANAINATNIYGLNAKELFESTDNWVSDIETQIINPQCLIASNGDKYELAVNNSGQMITIPVIPNEAAFFGNSLVWSNYNGTAQFGMSASSKDADFYARINSYLTSLNPNYHARKFRIFEFEVISDVNNIDSVITTMVAQLSGDENLVVLEGGDNVPTNSVETILPISSIKLLKAIRAKCPNARVCWLGIWYNTSRKYQIIKNACKVTGCTLVPIYDLNTTINQDAIGNIIDYGAVGTEVWAIERVSNLVDNGNNNITFTFTYLTVTKTATIDVAEYSYNDSTLSYRGRYQVVTIGYSHPGDRGMKAITNRMLYVMGISDNEETYNLD